MQDDYKSNIKGGGVMDIEVKLIEGISIAWNETCIILLGLKEASTLSGVLPELLPRTSSSSPMIIWITL